MEIKNFAVNFCSGRAKILAAVCVCLIAMVVGVAQLEINNIISAQVFKGDGVTGDYVTPVSEGLACSATFVGRLYCNPEHTKLIECQSSRRLEFKEDCSSQNKICQCTADYVCACVNPMTSSGTISSPSAGNTSPEGSGPLTSPGAPEEESPTASSGTACANRGSSVNIGLSDSACGPNEFCFSDGRCAKGCKTADGRGVRYGTTTCEKPSYLSVDGVYRCAYAFSENVERLRMGDGSYGSYATQDENYYFYQLKLQGEPCYSGCNSDTAQCNNEGDCERLAKSVKDAFDFYKQEIGKKDCVVTGVTYKIDSPENARLCYQNYIKPGTLKKVQILSSSDKNGIITAFEKFLGGVSLNGYSVITGVSGLPRITALEINDILCAPRRDLAKWQGQEVSQNEYFKVNLSEDYRCINEKSKMSSPFRGYSFKCEEKNGCGVYSWLLNQNSDKCGTTKVDVFGGKGYFCNSGTAENPMHSAGWSGDQGADEYGCAYYSVSFLNDKADGAGKNPLTSLYYESKIFTGRCYGNDTTSVNLPSCTSYFQTDPQKGSTGTPIDYSITQNGTKVVHLISGSGLKECAIFNCKADGASWPSMDTGADGIWSSKESDKWVAEKTFRFAESQNNVALECVASCMLNEQVEIKTAKITLINSAAQERPNCIDKNGKGWKTGDRICDTKTGKSAVNTCVSKGYADKFNLEDWTIYKEDNCIENDSICQQDEGGGNARCVPQGAGQSGGFQFECDKSIAAVRVIKDDIVNNTYWIKSQSGCEALQDASTADIEACKSKFPCDKTDGAVDCSTGRSCLVAANDCAVCGLGWRCKPKDQLLQTTNYNIFGLINITRTQLTTMEGGDGICVKDEQEEQPGTTGDCKLNGINKGNPTQSKKSGRQGIYVPFTLNHRGDCLDKISCKVYDDYNEKTWPAGYQSNVLPTTSSSNWGACVPVKSKYSGSSASKSSQSVEIPDRIHFSIECCLPDNTCVNADSDYKNPFAAEDKKKQEEAEKSCEGEACKTDNDCQDGLVCVDGKCVKKEDAEKDKQKKEEQEKQDKTAPNVNISSPSGTINTKTAQLSVTTDIPANCKYMLNQEGGLSAGNFDGAGMALSGTGGTSHNATLSNLTNITATNCKYNHSVTVLCKNSKASAGATSAIGSAQTNFSVDLSQDSSNAPVAVAVMESKYAIANPVLKVTTDRPADCEYKKDGDFTFGGGTKFDTTGSYAHNTQLNDLKAGDYTYYVVCQDKTTCAANKPGLSVRFKVDLSEDPANAPNIVSTTPETQTVANPTLSVTTDRPATCQYKKDVTFTYDGGTQFANDGEYAHSVSLADLPDGKHTFYVACKDKSSGAKKTLETAIVTTLNRGGTAGTPVISNTTPPSQNTNNPTLSVITDRPATCQYKQDADFVYGQGMQFTIDGGTGHSAVLANVADGTYTFYVVCQDPTTQISNVPGAQIIFTVNTASEVCASLSSNDKQNDNERDYSDEDDYNSIYVWRSVAAGTVESFEKVDWHAGYQLTPEKDGYVTQLCGYFDSGARNRVSLYDGNYKELAGVEIDGQGGWNCAGIAPAAIKANKRYYVIARVQDDAIYFAYKSGLLPRDAKNAVIESGIRQLGADGKFGESLKKYDYIVFGLVDAKIRFAEDSSRGPQVSSPLPDGNREKRDVVLSAATNEDATCKFDREDIEYRSMRYTFGATGQKLHQQKVCNLGDGPFTWYVRCKGVTDTNDGSTPIQFKVDD